MTAPLPQALQPNHLILVCCHAIYLSKTGPSKGLSESEWLLAPFQTGEVPTFTTHIHKGLSLLLSDPLSILVFSGSRTRAETQTSEAKSYLDLCLDNGFWDLDDSRGEDFERRILLDEQALDSFANLVFGILRFRKEVGVWPEKVTIVSHEFKRARFMELHVPALRWPKEKAAFVGVDPKYMVEGSVEWDELRTEEVRKGERERGFGAWKRDLLGEGTSLRGKRKSRNSWHVGQMWFESELDKLRSGVKTSILEKDGVTEEFLGSEKQPWE